MAVSQIQHLALMLGADGARTGLDKARGTTPSPNPLGDMLGRDCCRWGATVAWPDGILSIAVLLTQLSG